MKNLAKIALTLTLVLITGCSNSDSKVKTDETKNNGFIHLSEGLKSGSKIIEEVIQDTLK